LRSIIKEKVYEDNSTYIGEAREDSKNGKVILKETF